MSIFPACMFLHCVHLVPVEVRGGHWIPWNWSTDVCESPCGFWEPNMGSLEEQLKILNSEPSLHPNLPTFYVKKTLLFNILKLYLYHVSFFTEKKPWFSVQIILAILARTVLFSLESHCRNSPLNVFPLVSFLVCKLDIRYSDIKLIYY